MKTTVNRNNELSGIPRGEPYSRGIVHSRYGLHDSGPCARGATCPSQVWLHAKAGSAGIMAEVLSAKS